MSGLAGLALRVSLNLGLLPLKELESDPNYLQLYSSKTAVGANMARSAVVFSRVFSNARISLNSDAAYVLCFYEQVD